MTETLLQSAAPVFRVGGQVVGDLARDVQWLRVEEDTAGLKTLVLRLLAIGPRPGEAEEGLLYLDDGMLDFGARIEVALGPAGADSTVFDGFISGIEASFHEEREPQVVVLAEDRLMDLRITRRTRTYENVSDAQVAERIASEHGLTAATAATGPTYDRLQQWNMSDLAFLRERADRIQAEIWIEGSTLHFEGRADRAAPPLTLVRGNHLITAELRADLAHQRTGVRVSGYDAERRERIDARAGADVLMAETAGGRTGPAVLEQAFGPRVSLRVRDVPLVETEARDWARAEMLRRGRGFVTVEGTTRGSAGMVVGSALRLEGVGPPFEGDGYRATRVSHQYDLEAGFRTRFRAERPTINEAVA